MRYSKRSVRKLCLGDEVESAEAVISHWMQAQHKADSRAATIRRLQPQLDQLRADWLQAEDENTRISLLIARLAAVCEGRGATATRLKRIADAVVVRTVIQHHMDEPHDIYACLICGKHTVTPPGRKDLAKHKPGCPAE